ncbi:MAG TPA: DEAD/DEAH box helicase [Clostridiales bacterium]|nr:DEAD/DEAH box helicase [Clostridiales bacterium]
MDKSYFKDYILSEEILKAIKSLGYNRPTEVQQRVIPLALEKRDLVVRSQTGSGKTASYGIPICEMVDWLENKPQVLILTPTRELAVQVREDITNVGRLKRIKAIALYGRHPISLQKTELKQKNHVVVGTPGRIFDHIERGSLTLTNIKCLVIDEADEMLNMGFIDQVEAIIKELPKDRMTMLFSATLPDVIKSLSTRFMNEPIDIEIQSTGITVDKIEHYQYKTTEKDKFSLLVDVTTIENPDSCIIFCETKDRVDNVYDRLSSLGYPCNKIHGGMEQDDRLKVMNDFKRGTFRYLIATDVAARGIDIDNISLIINYDIPLKKASYVHRTGRTGRAGMEGKAVTLITSRQDRFMKDITKYIAFEIPMMSNPSIEEINNNKSAFQAKLMEKPTLKKPKNDQLNKQIMTLYFNGGKKKKLRATNFVGVISNIEGVTAEDIGIITIADTHTHVDILNNKGPMVLRALKGITICGKKLKISEARKGSR